MTKRVLLTGAYGNIGQFALDYLLADGHEVITLDRKTPATEAAAKRFANQVTCLWGDITQRADLEKAVAKADTVIHLAAVIPPVTEINEELATRVNTEATKTLIDVMQNSEQCKRLVFASSVAVYGKAQKHRTPPLTIDHPYMPDDHYGRTKQWAEEAILASDLEWSILRICVAPPVQVNFFGGSFDYRMIFDMNPDTRVEYVHPQDCARAFTHAVDTDEAIRGIYQLGGGDGCQVTALEFNNSLLAAYGIPPMPREPFNPGEPAFYGDFMDTEEGQRVLRFQQHTLADANAQTAKSIGVLRSVIRLFGPIARWYMMRQSPYRQS